MQLSRALRLGEREVVAFVGGGGKTTAMFRLAAEIAAGGGRVVTTTTTRISAVQTGLSPAHLVAPDGDSLPPEFGAQLAEHGQVLLTGPIPAREDKAPGMQPGLIRRLAGRADLQAILVEADGSRMLPFKAPAQHEPVVPPETTLLVPIAGADILGRPLDAAYAHRPELISRLTGLQMGDTITPEVVAALLAHPQGGLKNRPAGARVVALINKVDGPGRLEGGRGVARALLRGDEIDSVVLGNTAQADPVAEARGRVAAVVLAAGGSTRMGELKQVMPWGETTLVGRAADVALASQASEVMVVVGCQRERVAAALAGRPVRIVENPAWEGGQSTSVRAALEAMRPGFDGALFLLADQPFVSPELVDAVQQRHCETLAPIVAPRAAGRRANPALFDRAAWPDLMAVTGDTGGRSLFEAYAGRVAWVDWPADIVPDVDTLEDYQALRVSVGR